MPNDKELRTNIGSEMKSYLELPLLPLRDIVVFPSTVVPLFVGREKSIQALDYAMTQKNKQIFLCVQKDAKTNDPEIDDIYTVGTITQILQILKLPDGTVKVLVEGQKRAKVESLIDKQKFILVKAKEIAEPKVDSIESEAIVRTIKSTFDNYVRLNKRIPPEMLLSLEHIDNETKLADNLVSHLHNLKLEDRQELLEEVSPLKRLEMLYALIQSEIEILRVEKKIRARVKRQMEKTQKEYYLSEQMAAIQKELGDKEDAKAEIKSIEEKIETKKLSDEARERLQKEVKKLKYMSPMSAEATVVRNYIDTVLSLPWGEYTKDSKAILSAEKILNRDHYGLDKIKDRILEYLSIQILVDGIKGPILCFVGPPGVGKTSLAKSIAESLNRNYVRISLGGVRDQAEIKGHRRTYIGSMPGKIITSLKKAGSSNPVIILDEIDKMSADYKGDPAASLLEVLDPEQNYNFNDHYLDVDYDLSKCLFIATANFIDAIPVPLLDRIEVIRIAGYTEAEKLEIAKRYLLPKQLKENGLESQKITFQTKSFMEIIRYYTRESGVRNLEKEIANVLRKAARKHLKKAVKKSSKEGSASGDDLLGNIDVKTLCLSEQISPTMVQQYLGPRKFRVGAADKESEIGRATGLAWTPFGGEILNIEVAVLRGRGKLLITGKLGDVMQESAQAALSYVRSRASFLGLDKNFYQSIDIHIHIPEGATPKDGPSAGLCMATALISALLKRPVNQAVAMTGEITLSGRSLPIGGLKEKLLAAHRAGITKILFPFDNKKDIEEIPQNILKDFEIIPIHHMDQVLMHALVWKQKEKSKEEGFLYEKLQKNNDNHLKNENTVFTAH